jgi:HEAT repeat protein
MEAMAFEQGMGFVPFGGIGLQAFDAIHASEEKGPIVKATSIKVLAKDPDPRTQKALIAATVDKDSLVRAAAYDALARRGHAEVLPDLSPGLKDEKEK